MSEPNPITAADPPPPPLPLFDIELDVAPEPIAPPVREPVREPVRGLAPEPDSPSSLAPAKGGERRDPLLGLGTFDDELSAIRDEPRLPSLDLAAADLPGLQAPPSAASGPVAAPLSGLEASGDAAAPRMASPPVDARWARPPSVPEPAAVAASGPATDRAPRPGTDAGSDADRGAEALDPVPSAASPDPAPAPGAPPEAAGEADDAKLDDESEDRRLADAPAARAADAETRLIAYLQQRGRLTGGDLARARKLAEDSAEPLRIMLVKLGLVSDRDMAAAASAVLDLPSIGADDYPEEPLADLPVSLRFLKDARVVPLATDDDGLEVAIADPLDAFTVQALGLAVGRPVRLRVGIGSEIEAALQRLYEAPKPETGDVDIDADLGNFSEEDIEHLRDLASEAPVIRLVNNVLQRAVESRASDVHIEPFADELKVRYRIDGILKESESPPVRSTAAVISRIKIMAKLNIAERRLPQDGRIPLRIQGRELDLRVSTVPTMFGESVVMRLLDKDTVSFDFDALGFDGPPRERVLKVLDLPFGIFLVTGPTGSGKSTTLYTALSRLNTEDRKIITVEDPVEYQVPGINQIPVKASIGMTFAGALRAIVRQDPDIIMVGEMRDLETARIAVQSALTGHVVLSTLHTNDAASGVTRLMDMGVESYLLTSTINGILAQRLVRRLCQECREPYEPLSELRAKLDNAGHGVDAPATLYRAVGCKTCNGAGYRGRLVIAEVLLMSDRIRQAVLAQATASEIQRIAIAEGMATMYQDGLRKALDGRTTIEEVLRVAVED